MTTTKFVTLPKENLYAYSSEKVSRKEEIKPKQRDIFVVGNRYVLKGTECEGFDMYSNIYELVKKYDTLNGVDFASLVMKPIDVKSTTVFTLTKQDCANLEIPFEEGLQLFPKDLGWIPFGEKEVKEIDLNREYDENDMSTYPVDMSSKTVMHIILRLTGFTQISRDKITTPTGNVISTYDFTKSLLIRYENGVEPFPNKNNNNNWSIRGRIVTPSLFDHMPLNVIVHNPTHSIFVEIDTIYKDFSNDKIYGIEPEFLVGKNIDDIINVSWEEKVNQDYIFETLAQAQPRKYPKGYQQVINNNDFLRRIPSFI